MEKKISLHPQAVDVPARVRHALISMNAKLQIPYRLTCTIKNSKSTNSSAAAAAARNDWTNQSTFSGHSLSVSPSASSVSSESCGEAMWESFSSGFERFEGGRGGELKKGGVAEKTGFLWMLLWMIQGNLATELQDKFGYHWMEEKRELWGDISGRRCLEEAGGASGGGGKWRFY